MTDPQRQRLLDLLAEPSSNPALDDLLLDDAKPEPLSASVEERMVVTALEALGKKETPVSDRVDRADKERPPRPTVIPIATPPGKRRFTRVLAGGGGLLAAAAALVLLLQVGPGDVPEYAVTVRPPATLMGGATPAAARPRFVRGSMLDVTLAPARLVEGKVELQSYLLRGNDLTPWPVQPEPVAGMTWRLRAPIDQLPQLTPGEWDLVFVVATAGHAPPREQVLEVTRKGMAGGPGWRVVRSPIEVAAD